MMSFQSRVKGKARTQKRSNRYQYLYQSLQEKECCSMHAVSCALLTPLFAVLRCRPTLLHKAFSFSTRFRDCSRLKYWERIMCVTAYVGIFFVLYLYVRTLLWNYPEQQQASLGLSRLDRRRNADSTLHHALSPSRESFRPWQVLLASWNSFLLSRAGSETKYWPKTVFPASR